MTLYRGEPQFEYSPCGLQVLVDGLKARRNGSSLVIAIDGRSGGGKTTLAKKLAETLGAELLHTDDFAWWHSFFDWPEMLIENALKPLRAGRDIRFTPPAWTEHGRQGSIDANAQSFVIVEGVGSSQLSMRGEIDVCIWVQCEAEIAKQRGLARDAEERPDPAEAEEFWNTWQKAEDEFQGIQQSWNHAEFVVRGDASPPPDLTDGDQRALWLWRKR